MDSENKVPEIEIQGPAVKSLVRQVALVDVADDSKLPSEVDEQAKHGCLEAQVSSSSFESGYESRRNSMLEDPLDRSHGGNIVLPLPIIPETHSTSHNGGSSPCSSTSEYFTARNTLENSANGSVKDKSPTTNEPCVECPDLEACVDGPFKPPKPKPKLRKKSISVDSADFPTAPPKALKGTVSEISPDKLREALLEMKIKDRQLDSNDEKMLELALRAKATEFKRCTDFVQLHASLVEEDLVSRSNSELLNSDHHTTTYKCNRFYFEWLGQKGPRAYRSFYYALNKETEDCGHMYLRDLLKTALLEADK